MAIEAAGVGGVAVQLDDLPVGNARFLVQAVDVLGDDASRRPAPHQHLDGAVAAARFRFADGVLTGEFSPPRLAAHLLGGNEVLELDGTIAVPDTAGAAVVGNARFGADAGAGEHHGAAAVFDRLCEQLDHLGDPRHVRHAPSPAVIGNQV